MDPIQAQLWPIFLAEAREHLELMSAALLALERPVESREPGRLATLLRTAHSFKGSAGSVGFAQLERVSHALEDALQPCAAEPVLTAPQLEAALAVVRALEVALNAVEAGTGQGEVAEADALLLQLASVFAVAAPRASAPRRAPSSAPRPAAAPAEALPQALVELWPVFRGEALENAALLAEATRAWKGIPAAEDLSLLKRVAEALGLSGAALGVAPLEVIGREAQRLLEAPGKETATSLRALSARVEDLVEALDRRLEDAEADAAPARPLPPPPPPPSAPPRAAAWPEPFVLEVEGLLAGLEALAPSFLSPDEAKRQAAAHDARRLSHALKGTTGAVPSGPLAGLALRLHAETARLGLPGTDGSMAVANYAGLLVELREAFSAPQPAPAPVEAPRPSAPEPLRVSGPERAGDTVVRVASSTIDAVAAQVESLTLARARLDRRTRELDALAAGMNGLLGELRGHVSAFRALDATEQVESAQATFEQARGALWRLRALVLESARDVQGQEVLATQVREALRDLRTVPSETLLEPLRRVVRDVAGRLGKQVTLELDGGGVRLDRRIVEALKDPLLHLVRNAVDHGIEPPQTRLRDGKAATGTLTVRVGTRGHRTLLTVSDDGQGVDVAAVRERAVSRGLLTRAEAQALTDTQATALIFRAGFSTAREVSDISGRGVGLDVVQDAVTRLGGTVEIHSTPGKESRFSLELPQTIGAARALIVAAGGVRLAVPVDGVERVQQLSPELLGTVAGQASCKVGREPVPFAPLARVLGLGPGRPLTEAQRGQALVLAAGGQRAVLAVDELQGQVELVVHALGKHLAATPHLAGAAVMDDGSVVAVVNPAELLRLVRPATTATAADRRTRLLVADDSLTTRAAMRSLLEIAGYEVAIATDGEEALRVLRETPCALVVSDVQMPRLDGFELTRAVRADPALRKTPVILVTSLDSETDRAAGLQAGADGYLIKREVERGKLLELVRQLLPEGA